MKVGKGKQRNKNQMRQSKEGQTAMALDPLQILQSFLFKRFPPLELIEQSKGKGAKDKSERQKISCFPLSNK